MSDQAKITDDSVEVAQLLAHCPYRLMLYAFCVEPNIKKPCLLFDTLMADEPAEEALMTEASAMVDAGETVLMSFADEERREFVHIASGCMGWTSVKMVVRPAETQH